MGTYTHAWGVQGDLGTRTWDLPIWLQHCTALITAVHLWLACLGLFLAAKTEEPSEYV